MSNVDPTFIAALRDASIVAPELPQATAFETLERVREYERRLIVPADALEQPLMLSHYANGTATVEDETLIFNAQGTGVLTSADHATDPVRKATGIREGADHGTAGLVRLLVEQDDTTGIIPVGMQTGNAALTPDYPVKTAMDTLLPGRPGFLSVHGMRHAKLEHFGDKSEIHAVIGLGRAPSDRSREAAEELVTAAHDLGLRAVIGNDVLHKTYDEATDDFLRKAETGELATGRLAAFPAESTTHHAYRVMTRSATEMPAFQVEMTRLLRLLPTDMEHGWHKDEKSRAMGVHLGYKLMKSAVEIMSRSQR
jgi:hypothetical protein